MRLVIIVGHAAARFGGEAVLPFNYFDLLRTLGLDALVAEARTCDELRIEFPSDIDRIGYVRDICCGTGVRLAG